MPFGHAVVVLDLIDANGDDYDVTREEMIKIIEERLVGFEFSDHHKKKDQLKLTLRNDDYQLLENPVFTKGQKIAVTWGWSGNTAPPRRMVIVKVKGGEQIVVTANDLSQLMDKEKISRQFENMTDSEVVIQIAAEHGYTGQYIHVQETKTRHDVTQSYSTNARMLARLARKNGFEFYIDADGLHWHERRTEVTPAKKYIYRADPKVGSILSPPKFDVNLSKGVSRVKVVARDPITKELWELYGGPDDTNMNVLGSEDEMGLPGDDTQGIRAKRLAREDVRNLGMMTRDELKDHADAIYREAVNDKYKMSLEVIGDAYVKGKLVVDVYNIAPSWDGLYYVRECVSKIENGNFTQSLKLSKSLLRKVPVRTRKKGDKESENLIQLDDFKVELKKRRIITTDAAGNIKIANFWQDVDTGELSNQFDYQTSSVIDQQEDLAFLTSVGAQSIAPDAGQ